MQDLIERLEKAIAPDHDLSAAIFKAVWPDRRRRYAENLDHVTGSLDAALTLVPEGFQAYVDTGLGAGQAHACVWTDHPHRIQGGARQQPTPAIALCIAAHQ